MTVFVNTKLTHKEAEVERKSTLVKEFGGGLLLGPVPALTLTLTFVTNMLSEDGLEGTQTKWVLM